MKLKVLVDNYTYIDNYYLGEPAVCYYIEDKDTKILFDTGYSDIFIKNAEDMKIDLDSISAIVISHGHSDHIGGLPYFAQKFDSSNKKLIAHPHIFYEKFENNMPIGSNISKKEAEKKYHLILSKKPVEISEHITFLGEIPQLNLFEKRKSIGIQKKENEALEDFVLDDSAIVYKNEEGLFVITGCSHSGICNILEYAKKVCNTNKIIGVIGGFHLFSIDEQLERTIDYLKQNEIKLLYPCHCISFSVKAEIHKYIPIYEVGVGLEIEL